MVPCVLAGGEPPARFGVGAAPRVTPGVVPPRRVRPRLRPHVDAQSADVLSAVPRLVRPSDVREAVRSAVGLVTTATPTLADAGCLRSRRLGRLSLGMPPLVPVRCRAHGA